MPHGERLPFRGEWPRRKRWEFYRDRYGSLHALSAFVLRRAPALWRRVGPVVTRPYIDRWLASTPHRIVNLGGGDTLFSGWLTVDLDPRADAYVDVTKPLPFPDASIDAVFCEEAIEHIDLPSGAAMLRECHRVLRPGGRLRISTPDLEFLPRFLATDQPLGVLREWGGELLGAEARSEHLTRAAVANQIFYGHGHRFIYSFAALAELLASCGFTEITRSSYRDPRSELAPADSHAERFNHPAELSLFVDCRKPATA